MLPRLLQYYPLKEVLAAEYLLEDFRPDLIEMVLDKLRPEYVRWVPEPRRAKSASFMARVLREG